MSSLLQRNPRQAKSARRLTLSVRPRLEALEDRCLLSAGALDSAFGSGGIVTTSFSSNDAGANVVLLQPNKDIIAVGGASSKVAVARYTPSGSLDTTFGKGGQVLTSIGAKSGFGGDRQDAALAAALYPTAGTANDGKIIAAGGLYNGSIHEGFLVRYNSNGTVDSTFGSSGQVNTQVGSSFGFTGVGLQNGLIVATGDYATSNYIASGFIVLARYTNSGALDTTFGGSGTGKVQTAIDNGVISVNGLTVQPDGKIVVLGEAAPLPPSQGGLGGTYEYFVARYNVNGTLDTTFGPSHTGIVVGEVSGAESASAVSIYPSTDPMGNAGKLLVTDITGGNDIALIRYNPDGTVDTSFGNRGLIQFNPDGTTTSLGSGGVVDSGLPIQPHAAAIQANDAIVAAGQNRVTNQFGVARFTANGSLDTTFGNGGVVYTTIGQNCGVNAVAIQPWDDNIVAAGYSVQSSNSRGVTSQVFALARYLGAGLQIGSFTANPNPVASGSSTTLTASNISDGNPNSTITQVTFYYYDLTGNKVVLGNGTEDSSGDWILNFTVNLASGTYTLYAQAQDSDGVLGDPDALTLTVQ